MKFQIIEISNPPYIVIDKYIGASCLPQVLSDSSGSHYLHEDGLLGQENQGDLISVIKL